MRELVCGYLPYSRGRVTSRQREQQEERPKARTCRAFSMNREEIIVTCREGRVGGDTGSEGCGGGGGG